MLSGTINHNYDKILKDLLSIVTDLGRSDLAHYVCSRKAILEIFQLLLTRQNDNSAYWEKEIHNLIFPMGKDSTTTPYESHNLWLLDERLVFTEYVASDKKISSSKSKTSKKKSLKEPDLAIFDQKKSFREGDNEYSNPVTIFEFKRPKRENYTQDEDPMLQVGKYLDDIRAGKYETPNGVEKIKVNDCTPVYAYIVCDLVTKIKEFARQWNLTLSPDGESYFGFHPGYKMYIEIISFKRLLRNAELRNKIFFKKIGIE